MKVAQDFYVCVVVDSHGAFWLGLADQADKVMLVDNLQDEDGNALAEEMKAYLIPAWCLEHGFRCMVTVRTIEIEIPAG